MRKQIGVYTICKNEEKFVERWIKSMWCDGKGADKAYVLDTGSTDNTLELFNSIIKKLNIPNDWLTLEVKTYDFFRFDVARNDNLAMIKKDEDQLDVLVSVDLDEIMIEDFWEDLRNEVEAHPNFNRIFYLYAWNHDENNNSKRVFWYDKIHPVKGCKWQYPVHEELVIDNPDCFGQYRLCEDKIYLHHYADDTKSRGSYLPLLELRIEENPEDVSSMFYLMREYRFQDAFSFKAFALANVAYVKLQSIQDQIAYDCYPFFILSIADVYNHYGLTSEAAYFYAKALEAAPHLREPYISSASFLAYLGKHEEALSLIEEMEQKIPDKYSTWYEHDSNWTWRPFQIKAVALCWAGQYEKAYEVFQEAINKFIQTDTDIKEATEFGFFDDFLWLLKHLGYNYEVI